MRPVHAGIRVGRMIAVVALALLTIAACEALAADVDINVRYGFGEVARRDHWSPVIVELANEGPDLEGLLFLTPSDRNLASQSEKRGRFVRLPRNSRQRHMLFWQDASGYGMAPATVLGRHSARPPAITWVDQNESLVVVVGFAPGTLQYLSQFDRARLAQTPTRYAPPHLHQPSAVGAIVPAHVRPEDMPESPLAYYQVDLLVLGPLFASDLTPAAQAAITSWARTGGNLVITGGADASRLEHPFFRALLPVEGISASDIRVPSGLNNYGSPVHEPTPVVVGVPKLGARVLAQESGLPLVVQSPVGSGLVTFLAFDPAQPPLAGWDGHKELWLSLFDDRARLSSLYGAVAMRPSYYGYASGAGDLPELLFQQVTDIPEMKTPPLPAVAGFLALYFLLLIPVNHWLLGRRNRRELAWITTPVIVALFFFGAYGFGYSIKGPRLLVNQATVVEAGAGSSQALGLSNFAVFSPARRHYDIHLDLPNAILTETGQGQWASGFTPGPSAGIAHDEPDPWVERAHISMWGLKAYAAHGIVDMGGPITASIRTSGRGLAGWVENGTKWTLRDVELFDSGGALHAYLGDVAPGESAVIGRPLGRATPRPPSALSARGALSPMANRGRATEVTLTCSIAESPMPINVGRQVTYESDTLLLARLPLGWGSGRVRLPVHTYTRASDHETRTRRIELQADRDVVFTFTPPTDLPKLRVDSLAVVFDLRGGYEPPVCDVHVYDHRADAWENVGSVPPKGSTGARRESGMLNVPEAARFFTPDGTAKVKVVRRAGVPQVLVDMLDIVVEGER